MTKSKRMVLGVRIQRRCLNCDLSVSIKLRVCGWESQLACASISHAKKVTIARLSIRLIPALSRGILETPQSRGYLCLSVFRTFTCTCGCTFHSSAPSIVPTSVCTSPFKRCWLPVVCLGTLPPNRNSGGLWRILNLQSIFALTYSSGFKKQLHLA